jgi:hypothetical protein
LDAALACCAFRDDGSRAIINKKRKQSNLLIVDAVIDVLTMVLWRI